MRRILHYSPTPADFQASIADRAIAGCWFELNRQGGCGAGELILLDEFPDRDNIAVGDWIACEFAEDDRWYLGRVIRRTARTPAVVTLTLQGMSGELDDVFPGGFGRTVADNVPPHRYARTDLFPLDPDHSDETVDSVNRTDDLVKLLVTQYVVPRTHILYDADRIDAAADDSVTSLKFRGEESARSILREQALRAGNAAWGVDETGTFFFLQPDMTMIASYREAIDVLSLDETRDLNLLFNRVLLTGDYIYGTPYDSAEEFAGFFRWRGNYIQPASRDVYGERRIRLNIPWIRSSDDAARFLTEFFRVYAQPSARYVVEVGNQSTLPRPWAGAVRIQDRTGAAIITSLVETVRVQFDHAPKFRFEIGPVDPRTIWPEPKQDERWELTRTAHGDAFTSSEMMPPSSSLSSSESSSSSSDSSSSSSSETTTGGSGTSTDQGNCYPDPLAETLNAAVFGADGCACYDPFDVELTFDPSDGHWRGHLVVGGDTDCPERDISIEFYCADGGDGCSDFRCRLYDANDAACDVTAGPIGCGCAPLGVQFVLSDADCCAGTWTVNITE